MTDTNGLVMMTLLVRGDHLCRGDHLTRNRPFRDNSKKSGSVPDVPGRLATMLLFESSSVPPPISSGIL